MRTSHLNIRQNGLYQIVHDTTTGIRADREEFGHRVAHSLQLEELHALSSRKRKLEERKDTQPKRGCQGRSHERY